jgi:hypothetical protein
MAIRTLWWSSDEVLEELAVGTRLYNPKDCSDLRLRHVCKENVNLRLSGHRC